MDELGLPVHRLRRRPGLLRLALRAAHRARLPVVHQRRERGRAQGRRRRRPGLARRVAITSCVFVLGFSTVFVALGAAATLVGVHAAAVQARAGHGGRRDHHHPGPAHRRHLSRSSGCSTRSGPRCKQRPLGLLGAYVVGLAFAFGWTPCIGPDPGRDPALRLAAGDGDARACAAARSLLGRPRHPVHRSPALAINGFFRASGRLEAAHARGRGRLRRRCWWRSGCCS